MHIDSDVQLITPEIHHDERGWLYEAYNQRVLDAAVGKPIRFVQDNHSISRRGVLRGLHYQAGVGAQAKLVTVIRGTIFDVAVDLRQSSPTFRDWRSFVLDDMTRLLLWIPEGFAHGFLVQSDTAEVSYRVTQHYQPQTARAVRWDDPYLSIDWPLQGAIPILSVKDAEAPFLVDAEVFD